ncbi:MAG TPA: 3-dehydroquinate synthase, partial [Burkholderiales bacterium]
WLHGEAVAAGTMLAAELSHRMGLVAGADVGRVGALLRRAGLPTAAPDLGVEKYLDLMSLDKKTQGGRLRLILLRRIGEAYICGDTPDSLLRELLSRPSAYA